MKGLTPEYSYRKSLHDRENETLYFKKSQLERHPKYIDNKFEKYLS
jgi:hypothetical protein